MIRHIIDLPTRWLALAFASVLSAVLNALFDNWSQALMLVSLAGIFVYVGWLERRCDDLLAALEAEREWLAPFAIARRSR